MAVNRVSHLSDSRQIANGINRALRKTDALELNAAQDTILVDRAVDVSGVLKIDGVQVVGAQQAAIADAVDAVAAPTQAEFDALVTQFNLLLAAARAHGLIAT